MIKYIEIIKYKVNLVFIKIYSMFINENINKFLFLPNHVTSYNYVDIENYSHESVLTFLHYLITNEEALKNKKYEYVLVVYQEYQKNIPILKDKDGKPLYKLLYSPLKGRTIIDSLKYYKEYFSSHVIFTGNPMHFERFKKNSQIEIDFSYYLPFKSDYMRRPNRESNLNYVICASNIAAQIDSIATKVPYHHYVPIGIPKWDNIINPRFKKEELIKKIGFLNNSSKIIVYTPTHRDYERKEDTNRGFLGINKEYDDLNDILHESNTYLIVKPHPGQNLNVIKNIKNYSNIKIYESTRNYTIHDILAYADFLITDYTSVYFDYLVLPRPTLFYLYDMDKYNNSRGLSWNPVESICNGNICYDYEGLVDNIKLFISGKYPFNEEKYNFIKTLILGNNNTYSVCKRVYDFMITHI